MPLTPAQAAIEFAADELAFFEKHLVIVYIHGYKPSAGKDVQNFAFRHLQGELCKKNTYHWYSSGVEAYALETNPAGTIRAYVLGFEENMAIGTVLGVNAADPKYMFTYRMDGCSLGYSQASAVSAAYVSHHNDKAGGNVTTTLEGQAPLSEKAGAAVHPHGTVLQYMHKSAYMTGYHSGQLDTAGKYKASTLGIRLASGNWRFYSQVRKAKGSATSHKWTLKGLQAIN